jgi:alpha-tubulin suppressor-like RCC1 family protein
VCWGRNDGNQLGTGTTSHWTTRVPVRDAAEAVAITTGTGHACVQLRSGQARCWGRNDGAQLGDASHQARPTPGPGPRLDAVELAAGERHTCARLRNGRIACWGDHRRGQLGDGSRAFSPLPIPVANLP